jgi:hypothetical protein
MADGEPSRDGQAAPRRVVFLGASNLTRSLRIALATAQQYCGGPLEVFAALGYGRSYGATCRVLWRRLPGIRECGIWRALGEAPAASTAAVVTDIGNDLFYGAAPETIAGWVGEALENLAAHKARTTVTMLPLTSAERMRAWQFYIARKIWFPNCRISFAEILARGRDLDERLRGLAKLHDATTVELPASWFGFDGIHLRRRAWRAAWSAILSAWRDEEQSNADSRSIRRAFAQRSLKPAQRHIFGIEQRFAQPCATLRDGTTIAIY